MSGRAVVFAMLLAALAPAAVRAQAPTGALQIGDRILLRIEGESLLSDTFTVGPGPSLMLPVIGQVSLVGVRRADVERHLSTFLARYLRRAEVHARVLIRISVEGEVTRPGFYAVPTDLVLADAVMVAGGLTREAKLEALRIQRDDRQLWQGGKLRRALAAGHTLDDMGLRAGDRVFVPRRGRSDPEMTLRIVALLLTIPAAAYGMTRIF